MSASAAHDTHGLTGQRQLAERSAACQERNGNYLAGAQRELLGGPDRQEAGGPRWVGQTGRVAWLTPFAPAGFHEVWAVVCGAPTSPTSPRTTAGRWGRGCPGAWPRTRTGT